MKRFALALLFAVGALGASAQGFYYTQFDSIPVTHNGQPLANAWAGGFNSPQFSHINLNNDSLPDLFVFDRKGDAIKTFVNLGGGEAEPYRYAPEYLKNFPEGMIYWALMQDYNCDGQEDIFTHATGGAKVYRRIPHPETGFAYVPATPLIESLYAPFWTNLYVANTDIPALADIDLDGDLDILSWGVSGNRVEYHKNQSMELYGHCDSLIYHAETQCWGQFRESATDNSLQLNYPCSQGSGPVRPSASAAAAAHSGGSLLAIDLDGNLTKELIIGDVSFPTLVMVTNGGDLNVAVGTQQDTIYPNYDISANVETFPAAFNIDVNNDGKKDLLVCPNTYSSAEDYDNVHYYRNDGTASVPSFNLIKKRWLVDGMIEVGTNAHPAFADVNGDGLQDMIVGNHFYYDPSAVQIGHLAYYQNTGTSAAPQFELINDDWNNFSNLGLDGMLPTFGDLDNDGDLDMLTGDFDGKLAYFENAAGSGNMMNLSLSTTFYMDIDAGQSCAPQLIDIDRDGDLDLLCGERAGNIRFYENIGTANAPVFDDEWTEENWGGIDTQEGCCTGYAVPHVFESPSGNYDMLVGDEDGNIFYYTNIELYLEQDLDFVPTRRIKTYAHRVSPVAVDLTGNGRREIVFGEYGGGLGIFKKYLLPDNWTVNAPPGPTKPRLENPNGSDTGIFVDEIANPRVRLMPNPANEMVLVEAQGLRGTIQVTVHDVTGRIVKTVQSATSDGPVPVSLENLSRGTYIVAVQAGSHKLVERLIVR